MARKSALKQENETDSDNAVLTPPGAEPVTGNVIELPSAEAVLHAAAGTGEEEAIAEALAEAEQANREAEQALQSEGARVKPVARAERPPRTREQMVREARRQREYGRKLLARRTNGFASMVLDVKINNAVLASAFERFFPVIDRCGYLVASRGAATLGDSAAEQILDRLQRMAKEVLDDRKRELAAAQAVVGEVSVSMGEVFVEPQFTKPAYETSIQIRSPQARLALEIFLVSDSILTEAETLYWNGMRTISEKNEEVWRAKRVVVPMFQFAAATTRNLYRRIQDRAGQVEGDGAPKSGQSIETGGPVDIDVTEVGEPAL